MKWLIFGSRGWIGGQFIDCLRSISPSEEIIESRVRADDTEQVSRELDEVCPDRVISLIGRTHGPGYSTIDYLELPGKLVDNVRDNLYSPLQLAILCHKRNIHFTYLGTGCIFEYDAEHTMSANGEGFKEDDKPNFVGSGYSIVKGFTDRLMHLMEENTLQLRIRMPIVGYHHPRNFITKITSYSKVISIPNSMTILPQLLPIMVDMIQKQITGTYNFTNPGVITHNRILQLYRQYVDNEFIWNNFTIEEQNQILLSKRSNNYLDTTQLESLYPTIPTIEEGIIELFEHWKLQ
jgi:dTDP-4-dehydrorhamnose reductase